jgi:rhodanese-related sulfurtransferase
MAQKTLNYSSLLFAGILLLAILVNVLAAPSWKLSNKELSAHAAYEQLTLTPSQVHQKIINNDNILVVDLRSAQEPTAGTLNGAINMPFESIATSKLISKLKNNKEKILVAASENQAAFAWMFLRSKGVENISVMGGDFASYTAAFSGQTTEASARFFKDEKARFDFLRLMKVNKAQSAPEKLEVPKEKVEVSAVQGGC